MKLLTVFIFANVLLISITSVRSQQCNVLREIPCNELEHSGLPVSSLKGEKGSRGFPGKAGRKGPKGDVGPQGHQGETGPMPNMDHYRQEIRNAVDDLRRSFKLELNDVKAKLRKVNEELIPSHCWTFDSDGILVTKNGERFFCSKGWTVFQRRVDGRIADFHRKTWEEYANGFGEIDGEFWIGLRKLHRITKMGGCKLRVDLRSWNNDTAFVEYSHFFVDDEATFFRLSVKGHSGTAGDSLVHHNGRAFTTIDRDNDRWGGGNCAVTYYAGGWWADACYYAAPNGIYGQTRPRNEGTMWRAFRNYDAMKFIQMAFRCG